MTVPADEALRELLRSHIDEPDLIANLGSFARRMHFMKAFAHYEVFKLVQDLPGDVVECGVYKGSSLLTFARLVETFCTGDRTKKVVGFDSFKGLCDRNPHDGFDPTVGNMTTGWNPDSFRETLFAIIRAFNADSFVPQKPRLEIVDGDIGETAQRYCAQYPGLRISLLHLDVDLYDPTLAALEAFYPRVVPGGVVLFDEYAITAWPGETKAVEDYFDGSPPRIRKFGWASAPGGYFVKE